MKIDRGFFILQNIYMHNPLIRLNVLPRDDRC